MMNKRGQITVFVIVGIMILVTVFLVFYFLGDRIKKQSDVDVVFDESSLEPLQDYIGDCIEKNGNEAIEMVLRQGGDISPGFYQIYHGEKLSFLCHTDNYTACYNRRPFLDAHIESEINDYMSGKLNECINLDSIKSEGFNVQGWDMNVKTSIGRYNIIVTLDYPVTISKGNTRISENRFSKTFNVPLGRIIEAVKDVVEYDSNPNSVPLFNFDVISYAYRTNGEIEIQIDSVEQSKIYKVKTRDNPHIFQFADKKWARI